MKFCGKCGETKPRDSFTKGTNKDGLSAWCRPCNSAYKQAYRKANAEKLKETDARYRTENAETVKARKRGYHAANAERIRAKVIAWQKENPARVNQKNAAWDKANPHKANAKTARRRAALFRATPAWADEQKIQEFYFAANFLGMVTGEWYQVDHVVPLNSPLVCGLHCEQNLDVIPAIDNASKGNKHWPHMPL